MIIKDICENSSKYYISFLNDASTKIKEDNLISPLKVALDKKDIPYKTIQISKEQDFSVTLPARLVSDHWNLLIPTMDRRIFLDNYVKKLGEFASSCITYEVSLLGSQEWEKSTAEYLGDFNKLKVQIYTPYSINFDSKEYKNFKSKFSATYSKTLKNLHPSYGVLGYDVVTYFIGGISTCGDNFIYRANSISATGLQSGFQFQREKASDGYINRKVFHITYTK
ncbi:MAG TPA: hypothetical protein DDY68_05830 [Porphyromonadaceae bacterium]|nr:hypothetical protein [Porphyromonadaceae bacterium]